MGKERGGVRGSYGKGGKTFGTLLRKIFLSSGRELLFGRMKR